MPQDLQLRPGREIRQLAVDLKVHVQRTLLRVAHGHLFERGTQVTPFDGRPETGDQFAQLDVGGLQCRANSRELRGRVAGASTRERVGQHVRLQAQARQRLRQGIVQFVRDHGALAHD